MRRRLVYGPVGLGTDRNDDEPRFTETRGGAFRVTHLGTRKSNHALTDRALNETGAARRKEPSMKVKQAMHKGVTWVGPADVGRAARPIDAGAGYRRDPDRRERPADRHGHPTGI